MTNNTFLAILLIPTALIIFVLVTSGCVLLLKLSANAISHKACVLAATIGATTIMLLPTILIATFDEALGRPEEVWIFNAASAVMCFVIGWPVAHFVNRRLDQITRTNTETFS
jgi:hypothetical protein